MHLPRDWRADCSRHRLRQPDDDLDRLHEPGRARPGKHVTIYGDPMHVYGTIDGRAYGTSTYNPGGGLGWIEQVRRNPYRRFAAVRHPAGL